MSNHAGHMRRRGTNSWQLKYEGGPVDPATGRRRTVYKTFKGTRAQAGAELAKLVTAVKSGDHVDPTKMTLDIYLNEWELSVATRVTPKTLERYKELLASYVRPRLGQRRIQELEAVSFTDFYATLRREGRGAGKGLSARSVGHVHRVLHGALEEAVARRLISRNPTRGATRPRVEEREPETLTAEQLPELLRKLRGHTLYPIAALALATGMRRGELLALRWQDVDFDASRLRVERSLEQTGAGLRFKAPKSRAGRRSITLPASAVTDLRAHWKAQQEERMRRGLGKAPEDGLVFALPDGSPFAPDDFSDAWRRARKQLRLPPVTFHALRHTHVSQLIAAGLDVVSVSQRIGHGSSAVTLRVYAHRFVNTDDRAAQMIEAAMQKALTK